MVAFLNSRNQLFCVLIAAAFPHNCMVIIRKMLNNSALIMCQISNTMHTEHWINFPTSCHNRYVNQINNTVPQLVIQNISQQSSNVPQTNQYVIYMCIKQPPLSVILLLNRASSIDL